MPFRRRRPALKKRWTKKRWTKKRPAKKRRSKNASVPRPLLGGFPETKVVTLRYAENITLNPGLTTVDSHAFRLNSIYDPDVTGTGNRPRWSQTWDTIYKKYTVIGAKITVTAAPTLGEPGHFYVYVTPEVNQLTGPIYNGPADMLENRGILPIRSYGGGTTANRGKKIAITKKVSMKKYFGVSDIMQNTPLGQVGTYSGKMGTLGVGSNPDYTCNVLVFAAPTEDGVQADALGATVMIDYICLLENLILPRVSP